MTDSFVDINIPGRGLLGVRVNGGCEGLGMLPSAAHHSTLDSLAPKSIPVGGRWSPWSPIATSRGRGSEGQPPNSVSTDLHRVLNARACVPEVVERRGRQGTTGRPKGDNQSVSGADNYGNR